MNDGRTLFQLVLDLLQERIIIYEEHGGLEVVSDLYLCMITPMLKHGASRDMFMCYPDAVSWLYKCGGSIDVKPFNEGFAVLVVSKFFKHFCTRFRLSMLRKSSPYLLAWAASSYFFECLNFLLFLLFLLQNLFQSLKMCSIVIKTLLQREFFLIICKLESALKEFILAQG